MLDKNKFLGRMVMAGFSQRSLAKATGISKNTQLIQRLMGMVALIQIR